MKSLSAMILIAFVMLFTSEAKAQVPKQPPRKKMVDSRLKKCARILAKIGADIKPTKENCSKLQVVKEQAGSPRKTPARAKETLCGKCVRILSKLDKVLEHAKPVATTAEAKTKPPQRKKKEKKDPSRDNSIGFGVITDGKFAGGILTAEHIFYKMRWFEIGFAPKFSFLQGELPIIGGFANDDLSVTKFDFTSDFIFKFAPFRWFKLGINAGVGMRFLHHVDTLVYQDINGTMWGIEAGKSFSFLFALGMSLDFTFTKSLRMSVFYRQTTAFHQPTLFGVHSGGGSSIVEKKAYFDHIGGVTFSILLP